MVGTCFIAARSTSLGVLHRGQRISSHGKPALIAWSIVGEGSIGSPSDHIRSFQLSRLAGKPSCDPARFDNAAALSRSGKRNALDDATIAGIETFFANRPEQTRVIVIHGEGNHFSAAADLSALVDRSTLQTVLYPRAWHRAFERIESADVPVIAALQGAVIGGGLELAAAAHIRVAERSTWYALPESTRGIFVGGGGALRVTSLIGTSRTVDMMLTGRTYSAEEGVALGFSQDLVDDGQGLAKAMELAERTATNTALSNFGTVQVLPRMARGGPDALLMESLMAAMTVGDDEAKGRIKNFLEKRSAKIAPLGEEGVQ